MYDQLNLGGMTKEEFYWGMSMVQSRTFGGGDVMLFLPFIDLVEAELDVLPLNGPTDYRLDRLGDMATANNGSLAGANRE